MQPAPDHALEETGPEGLGLPRADVQADDLALAVGIGCHSDYGRNRDGAAALALLEVGGVQPEKGPVASQRTVEERH